MTHEQKLKTITDNAAAVKLANPNLTAAADKIRAAITTMRSDDSEALRASDPKRYARDMDNTASQIANAAEQVRKQAEIIRRGLWTIADTYAKIAQQERQSLIGKAKSISKR
jgi:hypothetical protein